MAQQAGKIKIQKQTKAVKAKAPKVSRSEVITISRSALFPALKIAHSVAEKKDTMPVLKHVLIKAEDGRCTLTASNYVMTWRTTIPIKSGTVARCVPAGLLLKEVEALDEPMVRLEFKENVVSVNGRCKIFTLDAKEFPAMPVVEGSDVCMLRLSESIKRVLPAVGEKDTRYTLNGIFVDIPKNKLVGTDGHRMHIDTVTMTASKGVKPFILPREAAAIIMKHPPVPENFDITEAEPVAYGKHEFSVPGYGGKIKAEINPPVTDKAPFISVSFNGPVSETGYKSEMIQADDFKRYGLAAVKSRATELFNQFNRPFTVTVGETHISFVLAGGLMTVMTIAGTFPDYEKIVPTENQVKVSFRVEDFNRILGGALPLSNGTIKLTINGAMRIQSSDPNAGEYQWEIPATTVGKKKAEIVVGLNSKYLTDAIKAFGPATGPVEISLGEPLSPCLVGGKAVVMPVRI